MTTHTKPYFDDFAELYERVSRIRDGAGGPVRDWLVERFPPGRRALDIGCGSGNNCALLAEHYAEVTGVDISPKMLEIAAAKPTRVPVRYECRDVLELTPASHGQFDLVMSVNAVFFMGPAMQVLPRLAGLVAPGGRLVVIDVNRPDEQPDSADDVRNGNPHAFDTAKMIYETYRDADAAADTLRMMLHPRWLEMKQRYIAPTYAEFAREYQAALPGVQISKDVLPGMSAALWDAR
jgi:SAM-dependent methyltransferase